MQPVTIQDYSETRFEAKLAEAIKSVRTILDTTRFPTAPAECFHKYDDKYYMVDFLTNTTLASLSNCLELLGLNQKHLETLKEWGQSRAVSLRFSSQETCEFVRKQERKVESPGRVLETKGFLGAASISQKVVTTVNDYFWNFSVEYELSVYKGNDPNEKIVLQKRNGSFEIKTSADVTPHPKSSVKPSLDVNLSWVLANISADSKLVFKVDRLTKDCHTPRRNPDVAKALDPRYDISKINAEDVFNPVVPLFEEKKADEDKDKYQEEISPSNKSVVAFSPSQEIEAKSVILPVQDLNLFLSEQVRSLKEKFKEVEQMYPNPKDLVFSADAKIMVVLISLQKAIQNYFDGVDYVESMLRNQLIAAIGKSVTHTDFDEYMIYHNRKIFREEYQPQPFSYAIRKPDHFPEGVIGIERTGKGLADPIYTLVRHTKAVRAMRFPINAATHVSFKGDRYLHAFVSHQFKGDTELGKFNFVARARQFSSFIVLLGTIAGPNLFDPKHALIVKNKDDITIPLLFETIPSAKAFRDAIESLSPEQQRFTQAFRSMQLASSVFGVVVLQIKPQLERLLKLPEDSLIKEIQMSEDLLELFLKYQIPSDLLSYDDAKPEEKVRSVQRNIKAIQEMISDTREKQLEEQREKERELELQERQQRQQRRLADKDSMSRMKMARKMEAPCKDTTEAHHRTRRAVIEGKKLSTPSLLPQLHSAPQQQLQLQQQTQQPQQPPQQQTQQPQQQPQQTSQPESQQPEHKEPTVETQDEEGDLSKIPEILDKRFEELDTDAALKATIIKPSTQWVKAYLKTLLATPTTITLFAKDQEEERKEAFDLLDALTRSGSLPFEHAELHVVIASTHCFDKTLMNTVIQDNKNPVEKLERSMLIVATTIHAADADNLVKPQFREVVEKYSPALFETEGRDTEPNLLESGEKKKNHV